VISLISVLWRRLDMPGHDACRIASIEGGYVLRGVAAFLETKRVCQLQYELIADSQFRTKTAVLTGFLGRIQVDFRISSNRRGKWVVNRVAQPKLAGLVDLDLGFTPATNLLPVRRLSLSIGEEAEAPAAYLSIPQLKFGVLQQRYKRLSRDEYEYESPSARYRGKLSISRHGVVMRYPGVFVAEYMT
jgi:hypothetical protein